MTYKQEFIKFAAECGVLTFGSFTLKSGRISPYFFNSGNFKTGSQLAKLGGFYASCIKENGLSPDLLFGPAYKGIPLVSAAASSLYNLYGIDLPYTFNRKEAKDHGEGGVFVGSAPKAGEKVLIIEDVITAGTAVREVLPLVTQTGADVEGMVILVDRMERGKGDTSAVQEVYRDFRIKVYPIVTVNDIIDALKSGIVSGAEHIENMLAYRAEYGV